MSPAGSRCLHELFAERAAAAPDRVALVEGMTTVNYGELEMRANALAHALRARGVGLGTAVGIAVKRSIELVTAMLGVLKTGAMYVPLDLEYPFDRMRFMLTDSGATLVLVGAGTENALQDLGLPLFGIDTLRAGHPSTPPDVECTAEQPAYITYTSGSTGRPKGTVIPHGAVSGWMFDATCMRFDERHAFLNYSSPSWDALSTELWSPLVNGARAVIMAAPGRDVATLTETVQAHGVTVMWITATLFNVIVDTNAEALRGVQCLIVGGEALSVAHVRKACALLPGTRIVNGYGPSETSCFTTAHLIEQPPGEDATSIPIGHPIGDRRVYLLDDVGTPVPIGVSGELCVGGPAVAIGYLNRPSLTADRFIPDPFSGTPGARLYRSGDLARWRRDGAIDFLGRVDTQVKIRGFRVEPGEVDAVLRGHPSVRDAVVVPYDDARGIKHLAAYVVSTVAPTQLSALLREYLDERLPAYMIPSSFTALSSLPMTATGKVDRAALPPPEQGEAEPGAFIAPRTPVEERLAAVWAELLGVPRVGLEDNFFRLGGDSIAAIRVTARARARGIRFETSQMFRHQTVAALAKVATCVSSDGEQALATGPVPLTPIQCWFFAGRGGDPSHFNQAGLFQLRRRVHPASLDAALAAVVRHHDALRLRFAPDAAASGGWRQWYADPESTASNMTIVDLGRIAGSARRAAADHAAAAAQRSLDLERGPLLRAVYFAGAGDELPRILLLAHHLVVDAVSWRILFEDLESAVRQHESGSAIVLPPKTSSYQQWALRLRTLAQADDVRAEGLDLEAALAHAHGSDLPTDAAGERNTVATEQLLSAALTAEETSVLRRLSRDNDVPIQVVLLTALVETWREWTGSDQLLVSLEGHGREDVGPDLDTVRTVGWFTTVQPLLLECAREGGVAKTLALTAQRLVDAPRRGLVFGLLRYASEDADVRARMAALPAPHVSFNYLGDLDGALPDGSLFEPLDEPVGPLCSAAAERRHALAVESQILQGRLHVAIKFGAARHQQETIAALLSKYLRQARSAVHAVQALPASAYTPDDFPHAGLNQAELDLIVSRLG